MLINVCILSVHYCNTQYSTIFPIVLISSRQSSWLSAVYWMGRVHNVLHCRQRRTEPWPQVTCTENFVKFLTCILRCKWTDQHTDMLIATLCTPPGGELIKVSDMKHVTTRYDTLHLRAPKSWWITSLLCSMEAKKNKTRMWANAQPDGRPAEHRWCPLFNAPKFRWRPLLDCRAVTLLRSETHWSLHGWLKLASRSQPLVGRSSLYCTTMYGRYYCLISFFPIVDRCLSCEDIVRQNCGMVPRWRFFASFLRPVFSASHVQHISDLYILNSH